MCCDQRKLFKGRNYSRKYGMCFLFNFWLNSKHLPSLSQFFLVTDFLREWGKILYTNSKPQSFLVWRDFFLSVLSAVMLFFDTWTMNIFVPIFFQLIGWHTECSRLNCRNTKIKLKCKKFFKNVKLWIKKEIKLHKAKLFWEAMFFVITFTYLR